MSKYASRNHIILLVILTICTALLVVNITQSWVGLDATNGVKRSIEAKNYLRYGFFDLKFGQSNSYERVSDLKDLSYYQHHPPLTSMVIAISFYLFGISEFSYRIVLIFFTLCSVVILYNIAKRCYGEQIAILSAFIFSIMPVTTFFGRSNYEPITQFFLLLSVFLYMDWLDKKSSGRFYLFLVVYVISLFTDWPAYFLSGILPAHYLISEKTEYSKHKEMLLVPFVTVAVFGVFLYDSYLVNPGAIKSLFLQGKIYMGAIKGPEQLNLIGQSEEHIAFTARQFIRVLLNRALMLYLYPVLVLSVFGFWHLLNNIRNRLNYRHNLLLLALFLLPTAYCVIFYKSTFIHWVWIFYFGAPFAMLAALGIDFVFTQNLIKRQYPRGWHIPLPYLFLITFIFLPALSNLKELHSLQRKVIPGERHESATLITNIARQLRSVTNSGDLILTNLNLKHNGLRGGTMVNYYAERKIYGDIDNTVKLNGILKTARNKSNYFFLWVDNQRIDKNDTELEDYLIQNFMDTSLVVEDYKFRLFRLH